MILIITCLAGLSIIITTLKNGISPMPTTRHAKEKVLELLQTREETIVDLGSGWGGIVIPLAKQSPQKTIIGYETSIVPYLFSLLRKKIHRLDHLELRFKNFLKAPLDPNVIYYTYLYPKGMRKLAEKLPQTADLISHQFAMPGLIPAETIKVKDLSRSVIYVYANVKPLYI